MTTKRIILHVEFVMDEDFYNEALANGETPDTMLAMMKQEFSGDPNVAVDDATTTIQVLDDPVAAGVV
jgi:hypothetical protein